ncbi:hypothetical protein [Spartinivicinus poritis]|uniref:Uncharacterized protein n=1 Tax=Spartinivicinus poritis TaxID=2994640 RepID=A0ABT5UDW7_9GAMM|nr:hypothetical protein [Spartinivicinus sp. A2-2]MDE1464574.1 hypothetical protein [Spartinivicinus sp. A2-2]
MEYVRTNNNAESCSSNLLKWILDELKAEEQKQPIKQGNSLTLGLLSYHATCNKRHEKLMHAYFALKREKNLSKAEAILNL